MKTLKYSRQRESIKACLMGRREPARRAGRDPVPVAGEQQRMYIPGAVLRFGGGGAGAQRTVVCLRNLILHPVWIGVCCRHGASSFDGINITKEKELVMTEI